MRLHGTKGLWLPETIPDAPTDGVTLHALERAGEDRLAFRGPTGVPVEVQRSFGAGKAGWWTALGNSTTQSSLGLGNTASGTATARTCAATDAFTSMRRVGYVSAASAGSQAGIRQAVTTHHRGNVAGVGGFLLIMRFGLGAVAASNRLFAGMFPGTGAITNVDPSSQTNLVGFAADSADTALQFITNDGSGTATKTSLGATNFPVGTAGYAWELRLFCPPNASWIGWSAERLGTAGSLVEGVATTDLPTATTFLGYQITHTTTTTTAVAVDLSNVYLESEI